MVECVCETYDSRPIATLRMNPVWHIIRNVNRLNGVNLYVSRLNAVQEPAYEVYIKEALDIDIANQRLMIIARL